MLNWFRNKTGFAKAEQGSITVEAVLVFPLMYWLMIFGPILFDIVRQKTAVIRHTYIFADIVSRETSVTPEMLNFYRSMFQEMHPSGATNLRMTSISCTTADTTCNPGDYTIDWSVGANYQNTAIGTQLSQIVPQMPWVNPSESVLLVEGHQTYTSALNYEFGPWKLGWKGKLLEHKLFIRPRYTQIITCAGC